MLQDSGDLAVLRKTLLGFFKKYESFQRFGNSVTFECLEEDMEKYKFFIIMLFWLNIF